MTTFLSTDLLAWCPLLDFFLCGLAISTVVLVCQCLSLCGGHD